MDRVSALRSRKISSPTNLDNSSTLKLMSFASWVRKSSNCCLFELFIDRPFKVRELQALGALNVKHVPTDLNRSDLLTKALLLPAFERHRASLMAPPGGELLQYTVIERG